MKLWIDDVRPAPKGYVWCHSVWRAIKEIQIFEDKIENALDEYDFPPAELWNATIELIDIDHDAVSMLSMAEIILDSLTGSRRLVATILFAFIL